MKNALAAFTVGLLFAMGLGLSGMTRPQKVIHFLDVSGNWDPSLMFVMLGAIAVHATTYRIIRRRSSPLLSVEWHVPTQRELTPSLLLGAIVFGIGWGLGGYCPGPALTSLASFEGRPFLFVLSMIVGMGVFRLVDRLVRFRR